MRKRRWEDSRAEEYTEREMVLGEESESKLIGGWGSTVLGKERGAK